LQLISRGGIAPPFFICYNFVMDRDKLKIIVSDLEMLLNAMKAEVWSDTQSYKYDDLDPVEVDYDDQIEEI